MEDIVFGFYEDCPEEGRGRKEAKRKRGRGGEAKVRGKEKHPFSKPLERGGLSKKSLVFRKERVFFYLLKNDNYGPASEKKTNQNHWFPPEPWAPALNFLTPWRKVPLALDQLS